MSTRRGNRVDPALKEMPIGTAVHVTMDDGRIVPTRTRSMPWEMGGHTWMVLLDGIAGGYALHRVQKAV